MFEKSKMKMGIFALALIFASRKKQNTENLAWEAADIDDYQCTKNGQKKENSLKTTSAFRGVCYNKKNGVWSAQRRSKFFNKMVYNGTYKDEEKAAHASDTLARSLIANGEQKHKLNFPEDHTVVQPEVIKLKHFDTK